MTFERRAAAAGGALLLAWLAFAAFDPARALAGWLIGWDYWLGVSVGCLGLSLLHQLTGGRWGRDLAQALSAGRAALPWLALLGLPVALGAGRLYPWASHAGDAHVNKTWLNRPFFVARAAVYLAFWWLVSRRLEAWAAKRQGAWKSSAWALPAWVIVVSLASMDWLMSLEAPWVSTLYGAFTLAAYGLVALAFCTLAVCLFDLPEGAAHDEEPPSRRLQDLGSLLLAFLMLWAYMALSQYLIVWSGNLPEEIPWYLRRGRGGWEWVAVFLSIFHFAVPFMLLLMQDVKRDAKNLALVALLIAAVHAVDRYWLVAPAFGRPASLDAAAGLAWLAIGGLWLSAAAAGWRRWARA